jgi:hypothetical protein
LSASVAIDEKDEDKQDDGLLDVGKLVQMFEDAESATLTARANSERDRDYYDNIQLTSKEIATLNKRGQPPVIDNRIKTKIDYLLGLEKQQRINPRALPRTPKHEQDADGASQALRYVADAENYDKKRSAVWRNILIEGSGGVSVTAEQGYDGQMEVKVRRWSWDRMFADPHSSETDYDDAGHLGGVLWMDHADALAMYKDNPDAPEILDSTLAQGGNLSQTYDDKPKFRLWADTKRKRVRICVIWIKRDNQWYFAEYTKGGILKSGPSPYVTDKGESDGEMVFQSAYVNRENERYGLVREMISLQDSINKRGSKSLHLLSVAQTIYEDGTIEDIEKFRKERARPDGTMKVAPGALRENAIKTDFATDLAASHFQLLQDAKNSIDLKGPNATMMGDKAQGSSAASGRAVIASQQGGMTQLGDLMDNLRHFDKQVFRKIMYRVRQFWTGEKWVRITDDENNVKWVGVNVDPQEVQMAMQRNPEMAKKIAGVVSSIAELDCDIIIDEVPDGVVPAIEQFDQLVQLKQFDKNNEIPFRALVSAAPNLKDKQKFLEAMDKQSEQSQQNPMQQLQLRGAAAKVASEEAGAGLKQAQTQKTLVDARLAPMGGQGGAPQQIEYQLPPELQNAQAMADIDETHASAEQKRAAALKAQREGALAPTRFAHEVHSSDADRLVAELAARQRKVPA